MPVYRATFEWRFEAAALLAQRRFYSDIFIGVGTADVAFNRARNDRNDFALMTGVTVRELVNIDSKTEEDTFAGGNYFFIRRSICSPRAGRSAITFPK